jgi:hypothetical protein
VTGAYQVTGADTLTRTLHDAADELADLSAANARAGDTVLGAARGRAPKRSGALAGSLFPVATPGGVRIGARVVYAGPVHWGWPARSIAANPFLSEAATGTESTWIGFYEQAVADAIGGVHGA